MLDENQIDDNQLFMIVSKLDEIYWKAGISFHAREHKIWSEIMSSFGIDSYHMYGELEPKLLKRIKACYRNLYDKSKIPSSGSIGIFCFRDAIVKINIPLIVGRVGVNPFNHADFTEGQKLIICNDEFLSGAFVDQFWDCYDIFQWYFSGSKNTTNEQTRKFIGLAITHQHAAAAILASSFDSSGAVQNAVLCCEMALKSCLLYLGVLENELSDRKKFGHDLKRILEYIKCSTLELDIERIEPIVDHLPNLVENRYGNASILASNVGSLVMKTQFVLSEVIRTISGVGVRDSFENCKLERVYPQPLKS